MLGGGGGGGPRRRGPVPRARPLLGQSSLGAVKSAGEDTEGRRGGGGGEGEYEREKLINPSLWKAIL